MKTPKSPMANRASNSRAAHDSATAELQTLLIAWRVAERRQANAVLRAEHPIAIRSMANSLEYALHKLRAFVDSEFSS